MLRQTSQGIVVFVMAVSLLNCARAEPLTEQKAEELIGRWARQREPAYAEVPQKVSWSPDAPKDRYDELAVRTLRNLERAGLVTVTEQISGNSATYTAQVTQKGFPILGTAPSVRGPVYRGRIAEKVYSGLRNFVRHPNDPTVGHAELVWMYTNPTSLYALFETNLTKPLDKPFASHVSFWFEDGVWKFNVNVRKAEAE